MEDVPSPGPYADYLRQVREQEQRDRERFTGTASAPTFEPFRLHSSSTTLVVWVGEANAFPMELKPMNTDPMELEPMDIDPWLR